MKNTLIFRNNINIIGRDGKKTQLENDNNRTDKSIAETVKQILLMTKHLTLVITAIESSRHTER